MTLDDFWNVIGEARRSVEKTSEIPKWLEDRLSASSEADIVQFGSHFHECRDAAFDARLWLSAVVIMGGCGDDSFDDFRGWLIAQGRDVFESALADPDSLAELPLECFEGDPRLEAMHSVGDLAYCRRAGCEFDVEARQHYHALQSRHTHPSLRNPELIRMSDEEAWKLFPKLATRFPSGIRSMQFNNEPPLFPRCD